MKHSFDIPRLHGLLSFFQFWIPFASEKSLTSWTGNYVDPPVWSGEVPIITIKIELNAKLLDGSIFFQAYKVPSLMFLPAFQEFQVQVVQVKLITTLDVSWRAPFRKIQRHYFLLDAAFWRFCHGDNNADAFICALIYPLICQGQPHTASQLLDILWAVYHTPTCGTEERERSLTWTSLRTASCLNQEWQSKVSQSPTSSWAIPGIARFLGVDQDSQEALDCIMYILKVSTKISKWPNTGLARIQDFYSSMTALRSCR